MELQPTALKDLIALKDVEQLISLEVAPCVSHDTLDGRETCRIWDASVMSPATAEFFSTLYGRNPDGTAVALLDYQDHGDAEYSGETLARHLGVVVSMYDRSGILKREAPPYRYL